MKKIFLNIFIVFVMLFLFACDKREIPSFSREEIIERQVEYDKAIFEIAEKYNDIIKFDRIYEGELYKSYYFIVNGSQTLNVSVGGNKVPKDENRYYENFNVSYERNSNDQIEYNYDLFMEFVNTFSLIKIEKNYCISFIKDCRLIEPDYKDNSDVYEWKSLNFYDDVEMSYLRGDVRYNENIWNEEKISISGKMKFRNV